MSTTTHLMTAEELIKLPRGQYRYELVKGELLTMSPSGGEHGAVVVNLTAPLATYVKAHKLGRVFGAETGFKLESDPDTVLAPDISFVRQGRLDNLPRNYPEIVPDLVVEVISAGDRKAKVANKTAQWLSFGVKSVWLVRPENRSVEIVSDREIRVLHDLEVLSDQVVPGFKISLSEIFE
jgi:Uma2 family endonuclease